MFLTAKLPRSRVTTPEQDAQIIALADGEQAVTNAVDLRQQLQLDVSMRTVSRRLKEAGFRCRVPAKKETMMEEHRAARLRFACQYEDNGLDFWSRVVFADEKTFRSSDHGQLHVLEGTIPCIFLS